MSVLVFDIATSRFHADKTTKEEPQVVRLAWMVDGGETICRLIRPVRGLTIDPATLPYHGIVLDDLHRDGVDAGTAIKELEAAAGAASAIASYHSDFHWRNLYRLMGVPGAKPPATAVDVMAMATPILAIPLMRPGGGFKSPSLREACRHFDVPEPATAEAGPVEVAASTVRAVLGIYKACMSQAGAAQ